MAVPEAVGVPVSIPPGLRVSPNARRSVFPDATTHVYGAVPPLGVSSKLYGAETVPEGTLVLVMTTLVGVEANAGSVMIDERQQSKAAR